MFGVGIADLRLLVCTKAFRRAVAHFCLRVRAVNLHQHRVVDLIPKCRINSRQVGPVAIAGKLDAICQSAFQIMSERQGGVRIACAEVPANKQLGIGADRGPRPNVASGRGRGLGVFHVVILGVNEAPDFIHLDALAGQLAQRLVLIGRAGVTGFNEQLGDRVLAAAGQPGHGADRLPLAKEVEDLGAGLSGQTVHTDHYA
jgi:hypothetical protein